MACRIEFRYSSPILMRSKETLESNFFDLCLLHFADFWWLLWVALSFTKDGTLFRYSISREEDSASCIS